MICLFHDLLNVEPPYTPRDFPLMKKLTPVTKESLL